jgi:hypothetical protein
MKYLFAPYSLALLAKENGFDEPCIAEYYIGGSKGTLGSPENPSFNICPDILDENPTYNMNGLKNYIAAPLYAQLTDWFREKHGIELSIKSWKDPQDPLIYLYSLKKLGNPSTFKFDFKFKTYYEALNTALTEAFKLITKDKQI